MKKTDADLLKVRSFGKTSLREVKRKLADLGLSLGMDLDNMPTPGQAMYTSPEDDSDGEETKRRSGDESVRRIIVTGHLSLVKESDK